MDLDKIFTLKTGVTFKISTDGLHALIAQTVQQRQLSSLANIRGIVDLYPYLSVVVYEGSDDLIKRRQRWLSQPMKKALVSKQPIPFDYFCKLFWRNLDEEDPDGDEWQQLIATDRFYFQLTTLLNRVRITERNLQQASEVAAELNFESA
ncbi:hypothetical protein ABF87_04805 [Nitrosomonas sp. JL21]|uniref:hypothetical protein n=1 Tax=Nitrosomonas sp. JL21 TaxID=153949 RepID=UPI001368D775|nr:hypothetical protein [Nitrosomonas sp. JL21]MBL8498617.1 hypothetical protein [Nitrosomonas sp.]MXS77288.1 hypothetical protein [Nitrosomonas sp. JL21]